MTSIKYAYFQIMGTITGKFHQNPLKTVGGVAETRLCLRTDGRKDGRTHYYSPLRLTSGYNELGISILSMPLYSTQIPCDIGTGINEHCSFKYLKYR